ncbi:LUD domain-containing protein [Actinomadura kijaniata]|uniref:L-lactate dehydrogenase complex protein LldG n=1 Tax=Actinomadura namibiensis TaxID=182080 RepID=A0A7W3QRZ6_ACTNM|nr:LUD domain-containing protein [Actinomadura namibiensis]MBA8957191.1 L-lactate dehydrogenase complex protein LldG [Actinomadura namibiensis]
MNARDAVLARVRAALADVPAGERPADVPVPRGYDRARSGPDLVELLVDRLVDYRAVVRRDVPVAEAVAAFGGRVAVPSGVPGEWLAGITPVRDEPPLSPADLDALDGVLTGCAVAIAETGTIVLDGSAGQGRRALTLVPDRHLCVVRRDQIVRTVPEALERLDPARPLTWISGPSATSDIELDRVEGVHGPRTLEVVLL